MNKKDIKEYKKYLGETIHDRNSKGNGLTCDMRAILEDIPLGSKMLKIGLKLRDVWFVNGPLYNSEVWCSYSEKDLEVLNMLDKKILNVIAG